MKARETEGEAEATTEATAPTTAAPATIEAGATEPKPPSEPRGRRRSASADDTSSVTTARDPGLQAENFTDMQAAAPSTETQVSVPGNVGFHTTGQQPDSVGDHEQVGTHAPVRGATGGGENDAELRPASEAEQEKGAESVGAAK